MIDALDRHQVEYVVVGAWAAIHHGALRLTNDVDVCVEWSERNLDRLSRALRELGAELAISAHETVPVPVIDARLLSQMQIGTWETRAGGLDVLKGIPKTKTTDAEFQELAARALMVEHEGRGIRVANLSDIVRSKQIANRPKDHEGLPELQRLLEASQSDTAEVVRTRDAAFPSAPHSCPGHEGPPLRTPHQSTPHDRYRRKGPSR